MDALKRKREQAERGRKVQEWLDDPLFNEPFLRMDKYLRDEWEMTKGADKERREDIWRLLGLIKNIQQQYRLIATTGKNANKDLLKQNG